MAFEVMVHFMDAAIEAYHDSTVMTKYLGHIISDIINELIAISQKSENHKIELEALENASERYKKNQSNEEWVGFLDALAAQTEKLGEEDRNKVMEILRDAANLNKETALNREFLIEAIMASDIAENQKESFKNIVCSSKEQVTYYRVPTELLNQTKSILNKHAVPFAVMSDPKNEYIYISPFPGYERQTELAINLANAQSYGLYCETKSDFLNSLEDRHTETINPILYKNVDVALAENFRNEMLEQQATLCFIEPSEDGNTCNVYVDPDNLKLANSVLFKNALLLSCEDTKEAYQECAKKSIEQRQITQNAIKASLQGKNITGFIFNSNDPRENIYIDSKSYIITYANGEQRKEEKPNIEKYPTNERRRYERDLREYERNLQTHVNKLSANPLYVSAQESAKHGYIGVNTDKMPMTQDFMKWIKLQSYDHNTLTIHAKKQSVKGNDIKALKDFAIFAEKYYRDTIPDSDRSFMQMVRDMAESPEAVFLAYEHSIDKLDPENETQASQIKNIKDNINRIKDGGYIEQISKHIKEYEEPVKVMEEKNLKAFVPEDEKSESQKAYKRFFDDLSRKLTQLDNEKEWNKQNQESREESRDNRTEKESGYDKDYYINIAETQKAKYLDNLRAAKGEDIKYDETTLNARCYVYAATVNAYNRICGKTDFEFNYSVSAEQELRDRIGQQFDVKASQIDANFIDQIKQDGREEELRELLVRTSNEVFNRFKSEVLDQARDEIDKDQRSDEQRGDEGR